jgi:hypothetical protein
VITSNLLGKIRNGDRAAATKREKMSQAGAHSTHFQNQKPLTYAQRWDSYAAQASHPGPGYVPTFAQQRRLTKKNNKLTGGAVTGFGGQVVSLRPTDLADLNDRVRVGVFVRDARIGTYQLNATGVDVEVVEKVRRWLRSAAKEHKVGLTTKMNDGWLVVELS